MKHVKQRHRRVLLRPAVNTVSRGWVPGTFERPRVTDARRTVEPPLNEAKPLFGRHNLETLFVKGRSSRPRPNAVLTEALIA